MTPKKIFFLTGSRADYGKIKQLIKILKNNRKFELGIIVTGMHLLPEYGNTVSEIEKDKLARIFYIPNQFNGQSMEIILATTVSGLSKFMDLNLVDLLIVHGDRVEALAGAIVGAMRNVLTAHIEGGEVSGTIDGILRHSISKLAHVHFVSNSQAVKRLEQLGENKNSIYKIGSPDIDLMFASHLPDLAKVLKRYEINFKNYAILIFHPVTTEIKQISAQVEQLIEAIILSEENFIIIKSNNDLGCDIINNLFIKKLNGNKFKHLPSMRFEYFLTLLKNAKFIIGNSSAGIRESPYYGVPTINIGSRQHNRHNSDSIINVDPQSTMILKAILNHSKLTRVPSSPFGDGNSSMRFLEILNGNSFWDTKTDKIFNDRFIQLFENEP
jgi:UDP-N-acetylglucosamine 2-epimerase (hydrolysing)